MTEGSLSLRATDKFICRSSHEERSDGHDQGQESGMGSDGVECCSIERAGSKVGLSRACSRRCRGINWCSAEVQGKKQLKNMCTTRIQKKKKKKNPCYPPHRCDSSRSRCCCNVELSRLRKNAGQVVLVLDQIDLEPVADRPTLSGRIQSRLEKSAIYESRQRLIGARCPLPRVWSVGLETHQSASEKSTDLVDKLHGKIQSVGVNSFPSKRLWFRTSP
jgi:hypothetical protein